MSASVNPQKRNGMGVAALVLGIAAVLVTFLLPVLGLVVAIVAIVLGILGVKRVNQGEADNRAMALWGLWLGIAAAILMVILLAVLGAVFASGP